jgi:hypothetical protein
MPGIEMVDLPSSSPAYTLAYAEKAMRWKDLGRLASPVKAATLAP